MTKMEKLQNKLDYVKECNESLQDSLRRADRICLKLKLNKPLTEEETDYLNRLLDYNNSLPRFEQC